MRPSDRRRLVILTEGQFGDHHAKTAYGVIRYGRDDVVAVLDSTQAGRNVREFLPGHDIPIVATLDEALGAARAAGRAADRHRPDRRQAARRRGGRSILAAIAAGLDVLSGLHTFLGDDPEFAAAAAIDGRRRSSTTADRPTGWRPPSGGATARASG